jgi:release factor glutamine methyltransferase
LKAKVAVIVANIPYVPPPLADAVERAFPEGSAIGPGKAGLDLVRELAAAAREFLMPGGSLALQLADFQWAGFGTELVALGYGAPELQHQVIDAPVAGRIVWPS